MLIFGCYNKSVKKIHKPNNLGGSTIRVRSVCERSSKVKLFQQKRNKESSVQYRK